VNLGLGEMFMGSGDPTRLGRGGGGSQRLSMGLEGFKQSV